ncbi:MAG TPA: hypothetical protein VKE88_01705 [Candidatus Nanoarchaeia archaeon]|nr:hypothetical protein [Candidatus Nanoarchaeia archaeon]
MFEGLFKKKEQKEVLAELPALYRSTIKGLESLVSEKGSFEARTALYEGMKHKLGSEDFLILSSLFMNERKKSMLLGDYRFVSNAPADITRYSDAVEALAGQFHDSHLELFNKKKLVLDSVISEFDSFISRFGAVINEVHTNEMIQKYIEAMKPYCDVFSLGNIDMKKGTLWAAKVPQAKFEKTNIAAKKERLLALREISEDAAERYVRAYGATWKKTESDIESKTDIQYDISPSELFWINDALVFRTIVSQFPIKRFEKPKQEYVQPRAAEPIVIPEKSPHEILLAAMKLSATAFPKVLEARAAQFSQEVMPVLNPEQLERLPRAFESFNLPKFLRCRPISEAQFNQFLGSVREQLIQGKVPNKDYLKSTYRSLAEKN